MSMRGIHWIIYWWISNEKISRRNTERFIWALHEHEMYHAYWTNIVYISVFVGVHFRVEHFTSVHHSCSDSPISRFFFQALSRIYLISIHVFSAFFRHFAETVLAKLLHTIWNWIVCGYCTSVSLYLYYLNAHKTAQNLMTNWEL